MNYYGKNIFKVSSYIRIKFNISWKVKTSLFTTLKSDDLIPIECLEKIPTHHLKSLILSSVEQSTLFFFLKYVTFVLRKIQQRQPPESPVH